MLRTRGDEVADRPLAEVGGTGVFVREIEQALLRREVDLAVHSLKDLETVLPAGLVLGAVPERADPADCLLSLDPAARLAGLPAGTAVATGSPRRRALLLHRRPDLRVVPVRGNVPTRIERLCGGAAAALVLARAGLERLGRTELVREAFDPVEFPPAPGQGALAVQCREEDGAARDLLALLDHPASRAAVTAERAFLRALGSGCHLAAGAFARATGHGGRLVLHGFVSDTDGRELLRGFTDGAAAEAEGLGRALAESLLGRASPALRAGLGGPRAGPGGER